jgi:hypothetical protein
VIRAPKPRKLSLAASTTQQGRHTRGYELVCRQYCVHLLAEAGCCAAVSTWAALQGRYGCEGPTCLSRKPSRSRSYLHTQFSTCM